MLRRKWWIFAIIALVIIGIVLASRSQPAAPTAERTALVARGTINASVSASGNIDPEAKVDLSFGTVGTVQEIVVSEGQSVKKDDVLARLDSGDLDLAVKQAEQSLTIQQLVYSQTVAPSADDLAATQANLASAAANLKQLQGNPDPLQQDIARLQRDNANETRYQVQLRWDQVSDKPVGGIGVDTLKSQYAQAVIGAQIAQLQYELILRGGNDAQTAAARAQVAQAQSALNKLKGDDRSRALALAQLQQSALNLDQAKLRLQKATLVAPIAGTVSELNVSVGESVGAGNLQPAVVVADLTSFHINVGVDESSVGQLKVGQPVRITIDALTDQPLTGHVDRIAPTASNVGGIISYKVTITLEPTTALVRGGMSANVEIVTDTHENILIVPNWTIRIDRATGKTYVNVRRDGKIQEVEILTGLRNASESEVTSGANEGDVLVVPQTSGLPFGG
ncbi:MAG TPA: efflux RND transporter periplasmic adaptor subunit [Anaerolineae bacterium]|nr:efflux RND transporter periplasmic adaptor subunit [Anaerolineae bacterium]